MPYVVKDYSPVAVEYVKGLVYCEMAVNRDAGANLHLLRANGELAPSGRRARLDVDVAAVTKMEQVLPLVRAEYMGTWRSGLSAKDRSRSEPAQPETSEHEQDGSAMLLEWIHVGVPCSV